MGAEWINEMREEGGEVRARYIQNKVPTLIVQGTEDEPRRLDQVWEFVKSTGSSYFPVLGGDHELTNPEHRKIAIQKALDFFDEKL